MASAAYTPLEGQGRDADHLVAFTRRNGSGDLVAIVPRLAAALTGRGRATDAAMWEHAAVRLPDGFGDAPLRHLFTGEPIAPRQSGDGLIIEASAAFASVPVALLWRGR
jgi:maltooligosyltrehalose synthase